MRFKTSTIPVKVLTKICHDAFVAERRDPNPHCVSNITVGEEVILYSLPGRVAKRIDQELRRRGYTRL